MSSNSWHSKTRPCKKQLIFLAAKIKNFQLQNVDVLFFLDFAQNKDCGYTLEPVSV